MQQLQQIAVVVATDSDTVMITVIVTDSDAVIAIIRNNERRFMNCKPQDMNTIH